MTADLPPLWLAAAIALVWAIGRVAPFPLFGAFGQGAAVVLVLLGLGLMGLGAAALIRARTTILPHGVPARLVTRGVFRLTRNPIYLGDALLLLAAILGWDVPLALPVLPLFLLLIRERFIRAEESRLRAGFGMEFDRWAEKVRRWI